LHEVRRTDLGVDIDEVVSVMLDHDLPRADTAAVRALYDRAARTALRLDGVGSVSLSMVPFGWSYGEGIRVPGMDSVPVLAGGGPYFAVVDDRYFETLGLDVVRGRDFEATDRVDGTAVAVVSETMAVTLWPGEDPIGRCFHRTDDEDAPCNV